jgi:hypothetical protein
LIRAPGKSVGETSKKQIFPYPPSGAFSPRKTVVINKRNASLRASYGRSEKGSKRVHD